MRQTFLFVIFLTASFSVKAADWYLTSGADDDLRVFVDTESIRRSGAHVKAWEKWVWTGVTRTADNGANYQSARVLNIYDCALRSTAMLQETLYAEPEGGAVVASTSNKEAMALKNMTEVVPDSVAEALLTEVCKRSRESK